MTPQPVLLLHGQPGGAADWTAVEAALAPRARAIAIDRPGWRPGSAPASLAANAAAAAAALDRGGTGRATVVGHSLGGAVAAWLAATRPERVQALVLVAPAANVDSLVPADRWLAAPAAGDVVSAGALAAVGAALAVAPLRRRVAARLGIEDRYLTDMGARLRSPRAWRAFAADQRALVRELPALQERLGQITAPTTIVAGDADRVVPLASARALGDQIPSARLVVLHGAGHLLVQQHPERVAEIVVAAGS